MAVNKPVSRCFRVIKLTRTKVNEASGFRLLGLRGWSEDLGVGGALSVRTPYAPKPYRGI